MKKNYRVAPEAREEIPKRINEEGIPVSQAAKDAGILETSVATSKPTNGGRGWRRPAHH